MRLVLVRRLAPSILICTVKPELVKGMDTHTLLAVTHVSEEPKWYKLLSPEINAMQATDL